MRFVMTGRFKAAFGSLPDVLQEKARKAIKLLAENPKHPSLRIKKMQGTAGIWEARVDRGCRMTPEISADVLTLRSIGKHDETLDNP